MRLVSSPGCDSVVMKFDWPSASVSFERRPKWLPVWYDHLSPSSSYWTESADERRRRRIQVGTALFARPPPSSSRRLRWVAAVP